MSPSERNHGIDLWVYLAVLTRYVMFVVSTNFFSHQPISDWGPKVLKNYRKKL